MRIFKLEDSERLDMETKNNSNKDTSLAVIDESQSQDFEEPISNGLTENQAKRSARRGTGPRTPQGKERSKRNATRHGLFSGVVVIKGESQADFDRLHRELRHDRRPEGALEELLVHQLATFYWRLRRFRIAESAEVQAATEFVQWESKERNRQDAARLPQLSCNGGLERWTENPVALEGCLVLLEELRDSIAEVGFVAEFDKKILTKLYGSYDDYRENWRKTLFDSYLAWLRTSLASAERREQHGYATPEECRQNFVEEADQEIRRLKNLRKEQASVSARKGELESLRRNIPEGPQLDRLLRYEATILRGIDRTLNQLERIQRMRRGQPVPPPINVNVTKE
jgi:hypothetical protein